MESSDKTRTAADGTVQQAEVAPPPWKLKSTTFMIPFWTSNSTAKNLPAKTFSPLEAASPFASKEFGEPVGGISMVQLIRYTESPVGPYDELILAPGYWKYPVEEKDGKKKTKKNIKITRIYVSSKNSCWGGRYNWGIPKHLARFEWNELPDGSTHVKVFPHDTVTPYDPAEADPSDTPFFQVTIKPVSYLPSFPFTSKMLGYVGIDAALVQPPLPSGPGSQGELAANDQWCKLASYVQSSPNAEVAWADMNQKSENGEPVADGYDNFYPGLKRWNIALKLNDSTTTFPHPEMWETPRWLQ